MSMTAFQTDILDPPRLRQGESMENFNTMHLFNHTFSVHEDVSLHLTVLETKLKGLEVINLVSVNV